MSKEQQCQAALECAMSEDLIGWTQRERDCFKEGWKIANRTPAAPVVARSEILAARAEGRAEAVALIMGMDVEDPLSHCAIGSGPCPATGEYDTHWDEAKLREAFKADDLLFDMQARAEMAFYEYQEACMVIQYEAEQRRAVKSTAPVVAEGLRPPTETMLNAARDWSVKKYGIGIGNDAAIGCWQAMYDAAHPVAGSPAEAVNHIMQVIKDAPANIATRAGTSPKGNMLSEFPAAPVPASEAAKQMLPQSECNAALRAAPAGQLESNIAMLSDAEIAAIALKAYTAGKMRWAGFSPNEDGRFVVPVVSAMECDLARAVQVELATRFRVEGGNTNDSNTNFAAPAAPTDAKPYDDATLEAAAKECDHWQQIGAPSHKCGEQMAYVIRGMKSDSAAQSVRDAAQPGCGACPGDGSICKTECRVKAESPTIAPGKDKP